MNPAALGQPSALEGMLDSLDTMNARQFQIAIRKLADDLSYGADRSRFLGSGIEYVQSRLYQYGDPVRAIDWRVTARTGKVHIKEFEAPKRMPCHLLLDTSASMTVSSLRRSKFGTAMFIAGGLAFACLDRVSPVGVLGVGGRDFRVKPTLSKDQVMQWMVRLRRFRFDEPTTLARRIAELLPSLPARALVIVLSDLHDPAGVSALKLLGQQHECIALQLVDPAEILRRGVGFLRAQEAETGRTFVTHGRKLGVDPTLVSASVRRAGIDLLEIRTDQPFVHRLRHFLRARGIVGAGGR